MTHRTILEWQPIAHGDGVSDIPEWCAERISAVAARSPLAGSGGDRVVEDGRKVLRARGVVGVIVAKDCTLEILPKIERPGAFANEATESWIRHRLIHMLSVAYDLPIATGDMTSLGVQGETLLEVLLSRFADMLLNGVRWGMPRQYAAQEEDLPTLRGRLDVIRQFRTLAAMPHRLACRYDVLSEDIALNQIMKAAVVSLATLARRSHTQRMLAELAFIYADVRLVPRERLPWSSVLLDRTNARWKTLLTLAKLFLDREFQTTSAGAADGFSILFDMASLFEAYVTRSLMRLFAGSGLRVVAQSSDKYCLTKISERGETSRFQTRPDILIKSRSRTELIVDTKWKRLAARIDDPKQGISQGDVYQMMAYGRVHDCPRLMLLYPHHGLFPRAGEIGRYRVTGSADELITATLDMAHDQERLLMALGALPEIGRLRSAELLRAPAVKNLAAGLHA